MARANSMHLFAGGCGDIAGLEAAGVQPVIAANHWTKAVETADRNYPEIDYLLGDISVVDPKRFGRLDIDFLVGGSECDGHSMANSYRQAQSNLRPYWGPDHPTSGLERSRATAWCFQRFASVVQPNWVLVENVVDIKNWRPLAAWYRTWQSLNYEVKASCVNSAFFGVPQSRDRVIFVAWKKGLPEPDLDFRYPGWCWRCEASTYGRQWFKRAAVKAAGPLGPMGKYGPRNQWLVRCCQCDEVMSPYITPAWTAIDWSIAAQRIADRDRPLSPKTMARIERGLRKFGWLPSGEAMPFISPHAYSGDTNGKNVRPSWLPAPTLTARQDTSLVVPHGFQVDLRGTNAPRALDDVMSSICASGNHHGLVLANRTHATARDANGEPAQVVTSAHGGGVMLVQTAGHTFERPGYVRAWTGDAPVPAVTPTLDKGVVFPPLLEGEGLAVANYGGNGGGHVRDTTQEPLGTVTAGGQQAVVRVPREALMTSYYSTDAGRSIDEPAGTITPVDRHAVVEPPQDFMVRAGGTRQADVASLQAPSPTRMPTDSYALLRGHVDVGDCGFRMIEPHENQAIQDMAWREIPQADGSVKRVPLVFQGSKRDRTALAGNGVPKALMTAHAERCLASVGA